VSSAGTSDVVDVLVNFSTPTPDEIYIHEENQESQEMEVEFIPIVFSFSQLLEFLAIVHQVSSGISSFSGCLEFSPVSPINVISIAVSKVCLLLMSFSPISRS